MLEPDKVRKEMQALQRHFREKRDFVVTRLREIGFEIKSVPNSTFYLWLDRKLPGFHHTPLAATMFASTNLSTLTMRLVGL